MNWPLSRQARSIVLSAFLALLLTISGSAAVPAWAQNAPVPAGAKAPGSDTGGKAPVEDGSPGSPGSDDGDSGANDDPVWGYFLGKTAYVFFHEIAGAMRLADGVTPVAQTPAKRDQLAALLLIAQSGKRFGGAVLGDAAVGWILSWRQDEQDDAADTTPVADSWDSKNLAPQQMSDLLCALYGSDPAHFHNLVDNGDLKADAAPACIEGFRKLVVQWSEVIAHAGMKLTLPAATNVAPKQSENTNSAATAGLSLEQRASSVAGLADFTSWLNDVGLLGNLVVETNRDLSLATPVKLVVLQCEKGADVAAQKISGDQAVDDTPGNARLCYEWLKSGYDAATAQNVEAPPE